MADNGEVVWGPDLPCDILRFIHEFGSAEKLIREHAPDSHGVCRCCHVHECTVWHCAVVVQGMGGSVQDLKRHQLLDDVTAHGTRPKKRKRDSASRARARTPQGARPAVAAE